MTDQPASGRDPALRRELGVGGAVMMGLGSIIGTGVFVSIGIAAGITGPSVILAIALAAIVAACNALSSAQLAASLPVSGGTYAYGYQYLRPWLGFTAGWMFLCAKTASAATAALGCSGYLLSMLDVRQPSLQTGVAAAIVLLVTAIVVSGIRLSNRANILIVSITLVSLVTFLVAVAPAAVEGSPRNLRPFFEPAGGQPAGALSALLHATALMFVAYTGYGRIATLGEEVHEPQRTIPRAIIVTLVVSMVLYVAVGTVAVGAVGSERLSMMTQDATATLESVTRSSAGGTAARVVAIGAITAMLGVLLNLVLGLSRVLLAMGRRGDMPAAVAAIHAGTPRIAVLVVGAIVLGLALIGSVRTTWTFSAFAVLVYYAVTNLAALQLNDRQRLFPRWIAQIGLVSCLMLAFWVEWRIWLAGVAMLLIGLAWHAVARRISGA